MSAELAIAGVKTGSTVKAQVRETTDERIWRTDTLVFEVFNQGHFAAGNYDITCTEQGSSGYFVGDFPTNILSSGTYTVSYYSLVSTVYTFESADSISWNGTSVADDTSGLNWITLDEYKAVKGITSTAKDAQLTALIPYVSAICNEYIGRTIKATQKVDIIRGRPGASQLFTGERPVNSVSTITFDWTSSSPKAVDGSEFVIGDTGIIRFRQDSSNVRNFSCPFIKAEYNAGYSTVPSDLKMACVIVMTNLQFEIDDEKIITEKAVADVKVKYDTISLYDHIPTSAQNILDRYRDENIVII